MLSGRVLLFSPQPCVIVGKSNGKEGPRSPQIERQIHQYFSLFIALRRMPRKRAPHLCMRLVVIGPSCSLSESTGRIPARRISCSVSKPTYSPTCGADNPGRPSGAGATEPAENPKEAELGLAPDPT